MISYSLKLYPKPSVLDPVFVDLAESIPPGKFYLLAPITVPYSPLPQKFILYTDAWANVIRVTVNDKEQARIVPAQAGMISAAPSDPHGFHMEVELPLLLDHGQNLIHVTVDTGQTYDLFVVSSTIASLYRAYSDTLFQWLLYPLQQEQESILSPWSPKLMENLLRFQDQLSDLRTPKTHAIKLAVKAMMAHSGTTLGVTDFATALTYNHPFIRSITTNDFPVLNYYLSLKQDVQYGKDFHTWVPSIDTVQWLAFVNLAQNLPNVFKITDFGTAEVNIEDVKGQNRIEQHEFTQGKIGPDFYGIIRAWPRMKIAVHTQKRTQNCFGIYNYRYRLQEKVLTPQGNHIFGRRPRHFGSIEAEISFSGIATSTISTNLKPQSMVVDNWGVNPSTASKINSVLLIDDKDISYIYHTQGGGATETFRFDVSSIPVGAIIQNTTLTAVCRGHGTDPLISLIATRGGVSVDLVNATTPTFNYTPITGGLTVDPVTGVAPNINQLAHISFGVRDDSTGSLSFIRVTQLFLSVQWTLPLHIQVMNTDFLVEAVGPAINMSSLFRTKISAVANLLQLTVSGSDPVIDLVYNPFLDLGEVIQLKLISTPPGLSVNFTAVRGHTFATNDGVDLWSPFDHPPILTTYTDPITNFQFPRTITPEIGFLGHSIMSTRSAGGHQMISYIPPTKSTALYGTMSGFFPQNVYLGVGSVDSTTKTFTFLSANFVSTDIGRILVITKASIETNQGAYVVTAVTSPTQIVCAQSNILLDDPSVIGKIAYRCMESRPPRMVGPQCKLLTESRMEHYAG